MKPFFFENFVKILDRFPPQTVCEIGTHNGKTASQIINHLMTVVNVEQLHYVGHDLFDLATEETHKRETNGKGTGKLEQAMKRFQKLYMRYGGKFTYELHQGFTINTLKIPQRFDFVFIDGGHSYETALHDYTMLKDSTVIVFDDYQMPGVERLLAEIAATLESHRQIEIWEYDSRIKRRQAVLMPRS